MADPHRIVIIGGGIAGLSLATRLGRSIGRAGHADIALLDHSLAHVWKPMLHTFAAGTTNSYQQRIPFVAHAARNHFRYLPGSMKALDRAARRVQVAAIIGADGAVVLDERWFSYDTLILAAGSKANDFGIPGIAEHCLFIDDLRQAEAFNARFYAQLLRTAEHGEPLRVAIVGGGATGVELASEISQLLDIATAYGAGNLRPRLQLTLIEGGPRVLAAFPEQIAAAATEQLRRLGIEVLTGTSVIGADEAGFLLPDGARIDAPLRVWAAGVKAPDAIGGLADLEQTRTGQLIVNPSLATTRDQAIFAVGDCASLLPPGSERPLPPTAQVARQQAAHLARHLPAWLDGTAIPPFAFRDLGSLVSLSGYNAYGTLGRYGLFRNRFIRGRFAQLTHAMLYRLHQAELYGLPRAAALWVSDAIGSAVRPRIRVD